MSTEPDSEPGDVPTSSAAEHPAPTTGGTGQPGAPPTGFNVKKVTYVGDDDGSGASNFILGLAITGEVLRGLIGVVGGLALAVWGGFMIKDGIQGDVAFTLHLGENNSLDVNTGVVGLVVMLIGVGIIFLTSINVDWNATGAKKKSAGDTKATDT